MSGGGDGGDEGVRGGFPLLRELSVFGLRPTFELASPVNAGSEGLDTVVEEPTPPLLFPRLERLHIAPRCTHFWHRPGVHDPGVSDLSAWIGPRAAPQLTHLRVSDVSGFSGGLLYDLESAFGK